MLRRGEREATSDVMDVVLQSLDTVNSMFEELQNGEQLSAADPDLLQQLDAIVKGQVSAPATKPKPEPEAEEDVADSEFEAMLDAAADISQTPAGGNSDEITDDEFEALLDQLHGAGKGPTAKAQDDDDDGVDLFGTDDADGVDLFGSDDDDGLFGDDDLFDSGSGADSKDQITESEFDAILEKIHGDEAPAIKAKLQDGKPEPEPEPEPEPVPVVQSKSDPKPAAKTTSEPLVKAQPTPIADIGSGDEITDDEFEALLDQLHGAGKGPSAAAVETKEDTPAPKPVKPTKPAPEVEETAAKSDSKVSAAKAKPVAKEQAAPVETTVRVDTQRLDDIMNMVGELVLVRNRLVRLGGASTDEEMSKAVANLDVVTGDLQTAVMKTRMQPIKKVFGRFPRVVRDLARSLNKEITLELVGEETDLDKNLVEALADPLVHLVRNSVDHGIEAPDHREKVGKPRMGNIVLAAEQEGDHILLSITDDGGGMDPNKLRSIAIEKGLFDQEAADRLTNTECFNLIFMPGFSTKKEISDVSGRGVGMDVVKTKITQLNGSLEIHSELGVGTRINIKVPLTLAIMPTLMIMLGNQTFALPLVSVNEIFHMDLRKSHIVDGREVINVRNNSIPLFYLKKWLLKRNIISDVVANDDSFAHVVIVSVGTQRVGFVVDQLIGQEEVVIKPLGTMLQGTPGMSGATITGDGRIALIIDVPGLLKRYA
jgi:two-component system chemotaxis sensor kinase CheA